MLRNVIAVLFLLLLSACDEGNLNTNPPTPVNATQEFIESALSLGIRRSTIDELCVDKGNFTVECKMFSGFSLSGNVGATYTTISYQRNSHEIEANVHTSIFINIDLGMLEIYHSNRDTPTLNLQNSINLNNSFNKPILTNSVNYQDISNWCEVNFEYTDSDSNPFVTSLPCLDEVNLYPLLHDGWVVTW
ncbi:hypothetical protein [Vibrio mediterranei]|uniref:hypothetical protein n=1 Tax=Vibrio mediterranei TaxID=689 RepID=UPI001EFD3406|nr:hypothetical protein [Vibrio mediterranei]MCG9657629.1 hypothetical protein [Vibrio mediterranei]